MFQQVPKTRRHRESVMATGCAFGCLRCAESNAYANSVGLSSLFGFRFADISAVLASSYELYPFGIRMHLYRKWTWISGGLPMERNNPEVIGIRRTGWAALDRDPQQDTVEFICPHCG